MAHYNYQIAVGWNNSAGLANIEGIAVSGATAIFGATHYYVRGYARYLQGQPVFDINVGQTFEGYESVIWVSAVMTPAAWSYLKSTYEGQVTIKTTLGVPGTYSNKNAWLRLPRPRDMDSRNQYFLNVEWNFIVIEAAS